jgi:molybdopterin-guanine dinucleotide biosynthesis protein A
LKQYVNDGGRKIDLWLSLHQTSVAEFADNKAMFKNINTPEDLKALENELK